MKQTITCLLMPLPPPPGVVYSPGVLEQAAADLVGKKVTSKVPWLTIEVGKVVSAEVRETGLHAVLEVRTG